jgi:hypothetical protein
VTQATCPRIPAKDERRKITPMTPKPLLSRIETILDRILRNLAPLAGER